MPAGKNFFSSNPHFAKSALARYTPADFIALVGKSTASPTTRKLSASFSADRSARDILGMSRPECHDANVTIFLNTKIRQVGRTAEFIAPHRGRRISCAPLWLSPRRPFDSQNRRDLMRIRPRSSVQHRHPRDAPRARPAPAQPGRSFPLLRSRRSFERSDCLMRRPAFPRGRC